MTYWRRHQTVGFNPWVTCVLVGSAATYVSFVSLATKDQIAFNPRDWLIYLLAGHYSFYLMLSGLADLGFAYHPRRLCTMLQTYN